MRIKKLKQISAILKLFFTPVAFAIIIVLFCNMFDIEIESPYSKWIALLLCLVFPLAAGFLYFMRAKRENDSLGEEIEEIEKTGAKPPATEITLEHLTKEAADEIAALLGIIGVKATVNKKNIMFYYEMKNE